MPLAVPGNELQSPDAGLDLGIADQDQLRRTLGAKQAQRMPDHSGRADDCDRAIRQRNTVFGAGGLHGTHR